MSHDKAQFLALKRRADKARDFPANTDSSSRHVYIMAENMVKKRGYPMLSEEPLHCAISLMATVAALWEARSELSTPVDPAHQFPPNRLKGTSP